MKNPFEKNDHKVLIAGIVIGSVAAGAAAYLFLTETGGSVRRQLAGHFSRMRDTLIGREQEPAAAQPASYMKQPHKKPKTDRDALLKHEILTGEHGADESEQNQPS